MLIKWQAVNQGLLESRELASSALESFLLPKSQTHPSVGAEF